MDILQLLAKYYARRSFLKEELKVNQRITDRIMLQRQIAIYDMVIHDLEQYLKEPA